MNTAVQYAVVRFMPYTETREFANIGVVLIAPKQGKLLFQMAPTRFARVTDFFDDLDGKIYKNALKNFTAELERVQNYCLQQGLAGQPLVNYFKELTRHRESVLHFGEIGVLLTEDAQVALDTLFQRFVARDFVTPEYRENQMVKALRQTLHAALPIKFTQQTLHAGIYDISMPLVNNTNGQFRAIKPLAFEQKTALKAVEHGELWVHRMDKLIKNRVILPHKVMFTVEKPAPAKGTFFQVYGDVLTEIQQLGIQVGDFEDTEKILHFAAEDLSAEQVEKAFH